mmetsp:Transcript_22818/g.52185  ORF Transcript_22818/g.52185 Transcript_22818/m.52185 type:complete len:204 (-) Transcript_22818:225-836(-)
MQQAVMQACSPTSHDASAAPGCCYDWSGGTDVDRPSVVQAATDGVFPAVASQLEEAWARSISAMQRATAQHVNEVAMLQAQIQARIEASWRLHAENQKLCQRMQTLQHHLNACITAAPELVAMPDTLFRLALLREQLAAPVQARAGEALNAAGTDKVMPQRDSFHGDRTLLSARIAGRRRAADMKVSKLHPVLESENEEGVMG